MRATRNSVFAGVMVAAVTGAVSASLWWFAATRQTPTSTRPPEQMPANPNALPTVVLNELDRLGQLHATVAQQVKERESHWRERLFVAPPPAVRAVCEQVQRSMDMLAEVESIQPIDPSGFATRPPSRIWNASARLARQGDVPPLPPSRGLELRTGPEATVAAHSGEFCLDEDDLVLPSRGGMGFTFRRCYRSLSGYDGPLGYGWDHNHNLRITADATNLSAARTLTLQTADTTVHFTRDGQRWLAQRGGFFDLELRAQGLLALTDSVRNQMIFEPAASPPDGLARWRLQRQYTRHGEGAGNQLVYRYAQGTDALTSITDPFGRTVRFHYDGKGRLRILLVPGSRIDFVYDDQGRLASASMPRVASSLTGQVSSTIQYGYEEANGRHWCTSRWHQRAPSSMYVDYDLLEGSVTYGEVRAAGYQQQSQSEDRVTWEFGSIIDAGHRRLTVIRPTPGAREVFTFNTPSDAPWSPTARSISGRRATWAYKYNADGLCIEERHPEGFTSLHRFDEHNADARSRTNCIEEAAVADDEPVIGPLRARGITREFLAGTSFPLNVTAYQIDAAGVRSVLKEDRYEYHPVTLDVVRAANGGEATSYFWNQHGQLIGEVDGCGAVTLHNYLPGIPEQDMRTFVDGAPAGGGVLVQTVNDAPLDELVNRLSEVEAARAQKLPHRTASVPVVTEVSQYLYDRLGRKIGQKQPGHISLAVFNRMGQPLVSWDSEEGLVITEYDELLRRQRVLRELAHNRDAEGPRQFVENRLKPFQSGLFAESYEYDAWGSVVAFSPADDGTRQGADRPVFRYERYRTGEIRRLTDPVGTARVHEYDAGTGLPVRIGLEGADGQATTLKKFLSHSPSGILLSFQDDCGDVWTTRLDSLGRAFEETRPDGVASRTSLDGMNRATRTVATLDDQVIDEQEWEYDQSGRTTQITRSRLRHTDAHKILDAGKVIVEENHYDAAGRLIRQRGTRDDAWKTLFYDGMGRVVAEKSPEGDWRLVIRREGLAVGRSTLSRQSTTDTLVALREMMILTERFRPSVVVSVDSEGVAQWGRASLQQWSAQGLLLESLDLEGLHSRLTYDTRGNRVRADVAPSRPGDRGGQQQRTWSYDAAGRLVAQTFSVSPLALFHSDKAGHVLTPRLVPVTQTSEWRYDSLGRPSRHDQPDGVQVSRQYDRHGSMVARMTWRHATKPDQALRDIEFRYGSLRRLSAVLQAGHKDPIQEFHYDAWGNCMRSDDETGHERVVVQREFDNLGRLWRERVGYGSHPLQDLVTEDDVKTGARRIRWQHPAAMLPAFWTEATYRSDQDGRVTSLLLNGNNFCQWSYQGQIPVTRTVPSSQTRRTLSLDSIGEVVSVSVDAQQRGTWSRLSDMRYGLDARGSVTSSTVRLSGRADQPESVVSQYTDLDAYRQIIGSCQESVDWPDMESRRRNLFYSGDSPAGLLASRTHRDQTGNAYARYQGRWSNSPLETAKERGSLFSPAPPFDMPGEGKAGSTELVSLLQENDRLQLASNRLTSTAYQGHEQPAYTYDLLGQLSEYAGAYWDGEKALPVFWSLTFDSLGRLIRMHAVARDPMRPKPAATATTVASIDFVYDAGGRRIVKRILDHATNRVRREATLYCDGRQTGILEQRGDGSWVQKQQYVWGPAPAEALQVVISPSDAGTGASQQLDRYSLHQDRGLDMVFATSMVGGNVTATPLATYLDTGENSSSTRVSAIRSSMPMTQPEACHNGRIDDGQQTHFSCAEGWNWLEVRLPEARQVTGVTIWTDSFPNDFEVYGLAPEQRLPAANEIDDWTRRAKADGRLVADAHNGLFLSPSGIRRKLSSMECPYDLVVNGMRTERLFVLWQETGGRNRPASVAECSVNVMPEAVSSLGQNGAWLDRETGLYYQLHRYRLPAMGGKFISPDPLGFFAGPDLYAYANNNPLHWHDPDGRFAHVITGAGIGAAFGGGAYLVECWISGEEVSWKKMAIRTVAGAATGAVAALTFGAASGFLAAHGFTAAANAAITGATTGGVAGFTGGFVQTSAEAMLIDGRGPGDAVSMGLAAGGRSAVIGLVGGAVGGAVVSQVGGDFVGAVVSGASGGAAAGGVAGAWQGYDRHGLSPEMLHYSGSGALLGTAYGLAGGAGGWAAGRASGLIRPMTDYPEQLPPPSGLLVRTTPGERTYGGIPAQPGYARHHVTPLSLGGRDVPRNIEYVPQQQHRIPHPPQSVRDAPLGTIFY